MADVARARIRIAVRAVSERGRGARDWRPLCATHHAGHEGQLARGQLDLPIVLLRLIVPAQRIVVLQHELLRGERAQAVRGYAEHVPRTAVHLEDMGQHPVPPLDMMLNVEDELAGGAEFPRAPGPVRALKVGLVDADMSGSNRAENV